MLKPIIASTVRAFDELSPGTHIAPREVGDSSGLLEDPRDEFVCPLDDRCDPTGKLWPAQAFVRLVRRRPAVENQ